jgi:hypothetical protein
MTDNLHHQLAKQLAKLKYLHHTSQAIEYLHLQFPEQIEQLAPVWLHFLLKIY